MFILGLQGSPRIKGNTGILLSTFLVEAESLGAYTKHLDVARMSITPCQECGTCEKEGFCPIDDDMQQIYPLLRGADLVVMATPIFFYGATAQMKALIDRSQVLWARRYIHRLSDPGSNRRHGFLLSLGATKGTNLFDGLGLTAKYFFDAVGAHFKGSLTYRQVERPGEIKQHPTALTDAREKARDLVIPFLNRKKILFVCIGNTCRSQMASAFARHHAGDRIEAESAGSCPEQEVNPVMVEVMEEKGFDMAFCRPKSIEQGIRHGKPDLIISMGCGDTCPFISGMENQEWSVPDPAGKPVEIMRKIRDEIEERVRRLVTALD